MTELEKAVAEVENTINPIKDRPWCVVFSIKKEHVEQILHAAKRTAQLEAIFLHEHSHTCIHHNDWERTDAGCPVCLKARFRELQAEMKAKDQGSKDSRPTRI